MSWKRFLREGMRKDLEFYLQHDKELYFKGMAMIAVAWLAIFIIGIYLVFSNTQMWFIQGPTGDIMVFAEEPVWYSGVVFMLFGALGFGIVKMYLHIRKDAIEIKEQMRLCGWDHK